MTQRDEREKLMQQEIQRLQDAKRRALALADERAKENVALRAALAAPASEGVREAEDIRWQSVNDEPFEYAIQQGQFGDEFVKLLNGKCLRRPTAPEPADTPDDDHPVEVWNGSRKVTVYKNEVMRIWGADMEDEMSSEQRDHQTVAAAFDWLYADGPADTPDEGPDPLGYAKGERA